MAALALLVLGHRALLLITHWGELNALVAANPEWLTWQYLTPASFLSNYWGSLLYLQQSPPIPNAIFGAFVHVFGWPGGCATALIILEAVLSATATVGLFLVLDQLTRPHGARASRPHPPLQSESSARHQVNPAPQFRIPHSAFRISRAVAFAVAAAFAIHPDLIVIEYNNLGQSFYEVLAMTLVVGLAFLFSRFPVSGTSAHFVPSALSVRRAGWIIGVLCALLALTRSAYALVIVPALAGWWMVTGRPGLRDVLPALLTVALLHGGWCLKNLVVFGTASPATSSWGGGNFTIGLVRAEMEPQLRETILSEPERYPDWFIQMVRQEGLVHWHPPVFQQYVPAEVVAKDAAIVAALGAPNRSENTVAQRVLCDQYQRAYVRFVQKHPGLVVDKFVRSYQMFWQPIRNYGRMYVSLFAVDNRITNSFNLRYILGEMRHGNLPEPTLVMRGTRGSHTWAPANLWAPTFLAPVTLLLTLIGIHLLLPIALTVLTIRSLRAKQFDPTLRLLLALTALYLYAVVTFNLPEFGENMRFRISVEPIIWMLSFASWTLILRWAVGLIRRPAPDRPTTTASSAAQ